MLKKLHKNGIALLITMYFIIVITVAIGAGLKYVNSSKQDLDSEHFLMQTSVVVNDVMEILRTSKELSSVKSADELYIFLAQASMIPLDINDMKVIINIKSARDKFSPISMKNKDRFEAFKKFLLDNMLNDEYAYMFLDSMSGIKEDLSYNTDIFNDDPYLFRDYIASYRHLEKLNIVYKNRYMQNNIENIDLSELFYPSSKDIAVDLNFATPLVWQLLTGCDANRANDLSAEGGSYASIDDIGLKESEKQRLNKFNTSFFKPFISVGIEISQRDNSAYIGFEYNIESKKGSNFVYEI